MAQQEQPNLSPEEKTKETVKDENRRKLLTGTAYTAAGIGLACAILPFVDSMNPSKDVAALASVEIDISNIKVGEQKKVMWRGKPVFITHRTEKQIEEARSVPLSELRDPEEDQQRVKTGHDQWLVMIAICTHLGCVPIENKGAYDGYFCSLHCRHFVIQNMNFYWNKL